MIYMSILQLILLSVASWVAIIAIYNIALRVSNQPVNAYDTMSLKEMIDDGNNLFSTALVYILAHLLCNYLSVIWLKWIIFVLLAVFAIIPTISTGRVDYPTQSNSEHLFQIPEINCCSPTCIVPLIYTFNIYTQNHFLV